MEALEKPAIESPQSRPAIPVGFILERAFSLFYPNGKLNAEAISDIQKSVSRYQPEDVLQDYSGYEPYERIVADKDDKGVVIGTKVVNVFRPGPSGVTANIFVREDAQPAKSKNRSSEQT